MNKKKFFKYKLYNCCKNNGLVCMIEKQSKFYFDFSCKNIIVDEFYINEFNCYFDYISSKLLKVLQREYNNEVRRFLHCRKRIESMFLNADNLYFLTFTISSKYYDNYVNDYGNFERYIKNALNNLPFKDWVFNLDFGKQNDRLHAHAIVSSDLSFLDFDKIRNIYKIGNIDVLRSYNDNFIAIEKYLMKFTNHSFKNTTLCRCHYKRGAN